jgi:cellulose synthase/poly-beta-1,6-N-acetylglucosamine synthase-like glycosyltransferase
MSIQTSTSTASDGKGKTTNVRDIQKEGAAAELVAEMQDKKTGLKNTLHSIENSNSSTKQAQQARGSGFDNRLYVGSTPSTFPNMHNNLNRKTICLNMIVKNEAHVIAETLENLYSYVKFDYYVICDTGSTDATKRIIANFFSERGVAGEIHDHEWRDFGHNRTLALNAAFNKADYSFIFDADDKIVGDFELVQPLRSDSYHFKFA